MHWLYQFAVGQSGWRYVEPVHGGEGFSALSSGVQNAAWLIEGMPEENRTNGLYTALKNKTAHKLQPALHRAMHLLGMRPSTTPWRQP